ncbi:MAG: hypothetical protein ACRD5H_03215 [Nitrososphaerales archaeon]
MSNNNSEIRITIQKRHLLIALVAITGLSLVFALTPAEEVIAQLATDVVCNGCVNTADIAGGAVTNAKIAANTITSSRISDGAVKTEDIEDGTIASTDIGTNAVGALDIADGAVSDSELADSLPYTGRLAFSPFVKTVASNGGPTPATFGLTGAEVAHNFVQIDCNDFDACVIPSTSSTLDISAGFPGQILIIFTVDSNDVRIVEQLSPGSGVIEVNLTDGGRTLSERGDTLILLYQDGEWNELSFNAVGPP